MDINLAFEKHHNRLMDIPGVQGVGIGEKNNKPAIVIMVKDTTPEMTSKLPQELEGNPVVIEQSGEITPF